MNLIHEILILYNRYDWLQISHAGYSKDTNLGLVHSGTVMPLSSMVAIYLQLASFLGLGTRLIYSGTFLKGHL